MYLVAVTDKHSQNNDSNKKNNLDGGLLVLT
jgi:hypothetical protein